MLIASAAGGLSGASRRNAATLAWLLASFLSPASADGPLHEQIAELTRRGLLSEQGDWLVLTRPALLKIDVILHAFFLPQHQNARYT
jgi:hypothetical protein